MKQLIIIIIFVLAGANVCNCQIEGTLIFDVEEHAALIGNVFQTSATINSYNRFECAGIQCYDENGKIYTFSQSVYVNGEKFYTYTYMWDALYISADKQVAALYYNLVNGMFCNVIRFKKY